MTVDFRDVDKVACRGEEIAEVWKGGQLVWKKQSGDVLFYAKDGAICKYKVSELSQMVVDYIGQPISQPLTLLSMDINAGSIDDMFKSCYQDDPHLSAVKINVSEDFSIISADTPVLSVIDDNPGILSIIPPYGFALCKDLQYIRAAGVKEIGPFAFLMEFL